MHVLIVCVYVRISGFFVFVYVFVIFIVNVVESKIGCAFLRF